MGHNVYSKWFPPIIAVALAALSASTVISLYVCRKKSRELGSKIQQLELHLNASLQKCAAERRGRINTQQELRNALAHPNSESLEQTSFPMRAIGVVQSCFSTRNGTPRQPLLVPLARACLVFDSARVPPASLDGLAEYSHCWIIFVFHLNTDLEKLWKPSSRSKFKAKVRVPRLKGKRLGVFATRSPHRPCPIGLTVAKVEAVRGNMVLLSGVDLVDGTPILDIKPYLPYCDSIQEAAVPEWLMVENTLAVASVSFSEGFLSSLSDLWETVKKKSLYASPSELQCLIKQVLSWDIRSVSQRNQPHDALIKTGNGEEPYTAGIADGGHAGHENDDDASTPSPDVTYHLILEGIVVSYRIDIDGNVIVERAAMSCEIPSGNKRCNYLMWRENLS